MTSYGSGFSKYVGQKRRPWNMGLKKHMQRGWQKAKLAGEQEVVGLLWVKCS